ncbi:MAG: LPS export ABC transporter periplasmic protein LptC [Bdellovibrionales bacterium]|nr:LPS export ABC transporter periplasmic protein LptC [Bdellovibrionales bacterium]
MARLIGWLGGLLLLVVFLEVFFLNPKDVTNDSLKNPKASQSSDENEKKIPSQVISSVELMESNEDGKEWELKSEKASLYEEDSIWDLNKVNTKLFGKSDVEYNVRGDKGTVFIQKKNITIKGNVRIESSNGYEFSTASAEYLSEKRELLAQNEVVMKGPKSEGEKQINLTGVGLLANLETNVIYVLRDVHARKGIENGQFFTIQSGSAEFSGVEKVAKFFRDVVVDIGGTRITGPQAELVYDRQKSNLKSMSVVGGIRISDIDKWAAADRIDMYFEQNKYILRGAPRVIQNNDELAGDEIVFYNGGEEIEVKGAKAKFNKD